MNRPQIIVTHGVAYFGTATKRKDFTEVTEAIKIGDKSSISSADIRKWYMAKETDDLMNITVQGQGAVAINNLSSKLETYFDICFKLMSDARDNAIPALVVKEFANLCDTI